MRASGLSTDETLQFPTQIGKSEEVYRDPYTVIRRQAVEFDGFRKEYYMWDRGVRAAIIPFWQGQVLFSRQYRFLANRITTEIPGGKVEPGEDPAVAAVRECAEETGVRCLNPTQLVHYHPGLDTYHNPTTIFYATEFEGPIPEVDEKFLWLDLDEAIGRIHSGAINDSLSLIGLFSLKYRVDKFS